jgi:flagellar motility protein MotE (MotC chaperone)
VKPARFLRLLPAVVIVGVGLLAIKGVDIARAAQGVATNSDDPDNAGLAPTDTGGAPRPDYANGDDPSASAAEVDVLTSLTHRRGELDARERGLNMRENLLNASEGRVNQKIAALQALQTQIQGLLKQRDAAQDTQMAALIKSYGPDGMKSGQAAAIFNTMPDEVLIPIAKGLKPADLGAILSKMNPDAAQKLTVKLAALLKLPETAATAACPIPAAGPVPPPGTTADAAPLPGTNPPVTLDTPPQQTAALAPPPAATPAPPPATTPPAPTTAPATAPAAAPAKPQTAAAPPPKPHHTAPPPRVAHATPPPKATPHVTGLVPVQAAAVTPPKPSTTTPAPAQAAATTPPPKPSTTVPAPVQAAATTPPSSPPAAPPGATPASTAPTPLTH